jgi:outer membrane immunogenic protein
MFRVALVKSVMAAALAMVVVAPAVHAADLGGRYPSMKDEPYEGSPRYLWTGLYAGLQAGYGWADAYQWDGVGAVFGSGEVDGFVGGGTLGYNFQRGQIVWGIEGDISYTDINGTTGCGGSCSAGMDWLFTLRGRVGLDMNGWMPYITGGLAVADVHADNGISKESSTETGWTVGGGLEVKLDRNWSFKGEYLYVDVGNSFCGFANGDRASVEDLHIVRAGINYKF